MNISIDMRSGIPIYLQIVEAIHQQVASGELKKGEQLPTVRALALELRINFNTVARAYRLLDESGIISTQKGRGTYILEMPPPEVVERLRRETMEAITHQFLAQSKSMGFSVEDAIASIRLHSSQKQHQQ